MTEPRTGDRLTELRHSAADDGSTGRAGGAAPGLGVLVSETYRAVPESVGLLRALVADLANKAGLAPAAVERVKLAVSEAATNVVVHAYRDVREPGMICVEATLTQSELCVSIADTGCGLTPGHASPGLGLGLGLIAALADSFELLPGRDSGLLVLLHFAMPASSPGAR
jgi:anti-sigma regulatory factor (Ser/Thr protein kinase)